MHHFNPPFLPGQNSLVKRGHYRDHPYAYTWQATLASQGTPPVDTWHVPPSVRTSTRHSSDRHVACPTLYPDDHKALRRWMNTWHAHLSVRMSSLDLVVVVPNRISNRISLAIITHFAKSILDRTFLGLFKSPTTTYHAPPVE